MKIETYTRLFTYGSLQPGWWNYPHFSHCVVDVIKDVTTQGRIYWVDGYVGAYPVAKFDEPGTIRGTILVCDTSDPAYEAMRCMEEGAGYVVRSITCKVEDHRLNAIGFHYRYLCLPEWQIESGDWATECRISESLD